MSSPTRTRAPSFVHGLAGHGDAVAVRTADAEITYAELAARVDEVAHRLGGGRRLVLVAGGNALDPLVTYLAALSAGHPVLLAPGDHPGGLAALVSAYDPDVVLAPTEAGWELRERREGSAHDLHDDLALLLTTSGSTGSPKLVRLSHANLQANAEAVAASLGVRATDRAVTTLPLHYCYGLSVVHSHLLRGAGLVLTDLSVVDACFWELFRRAGATTLAGVPYTFELLDRVGFDDMDLPSLRYVTQAGGRLAPDRVRHYAELGRRRGWDLHVMYGQTEATARMACLPPDLAASRPRSIGRPVPGGSFRLDPVDEADDDVGELVYTGPNVMMGYARTPADLATGHTLTELRTGDLARRTPGGLYEVVGRRSRFAKVFGLRLDLEHLDVVLAGHGITACSVDGDGDGALDVAVEGPADAGAVVRLAATTCGLPARAVRVHVVPALPRTAAGKPDLTAVRALGGQAPEVAVPAQRGAAAPDLRALFAEVLDRADVGDDDSFTSLGGDSLSYVEMSLRLEQALGHLPAGWHTTRIGDLRPSAHGRRRGRAVETGVLLRAVAILLVVGTHANALALAGGAHVLIGIAGFNLARFHLTAAPRARRARGLLHSVARLAVPTAVWVAGVTLLTDQYGLTNVLLLNEVLGPEALGPDWRLWFVEAVVHLLLLLTLVLAVPALDRAERRRPFAFAGALVAVGLLLRWDAVGVDLGPGALVTAPAVLWLFALGWATAKATSAAHRVAVTAVVLVTVPGFTGDLRRDAVVAVGLLLLVWVPSVRIPAWSSRVVGVLAAASLYVYVTHWQVFPHLQDDHPWLATAASFAVGIAYWRAVLVAPRLAGRVRRRLTTRSER